MHSSSPAAPSLLLPSGSVPLHQMEMGLWRALTHQLQRQSSRQQHSCAAPQTRAHAQVNRYGRRKVLDDRRNEGQCHRVNCLRVPVGSLLEMSKVKLALPLTTR